MQTDGLFLPAEIIFNLLWFGMLAISGVIIYRILKREDPSESSSDYMDEG